MLTSRNNYCISRYRTAARMQYYCHTAGRFLFTTLNHTQRFLLYSIDLRQNCSISKCYTRKLRNCPFYKEIHTLYKQSYTILTARSCCEETQAAVVVCEPASEQPSGMACSRTVGDDDDEMSSSSASSSSEGDRRPLLVVDDDPSALELSLKLD